MKKILLSLSLLLCPAALPAQGWDWPASDFDGIYTGEQLRFTAPHAPRLASDGSVRRHLPARTSQDFGLFTLRPDGRLCIDYGDGTSNCDLYLREGQMRMLVTEGRGRLPFRFELGLGN
ncbi:MAG: hypothetical protein P1U75_09395 [Antarcticimicrobium sp.]|uniref:hypothetical protein n=1 Tax=Antarcticimicrobium sp. TaxID=2824147 RepID=UPI00261C5F5F|nr:hypothetical protein [Antarcticimicrobium sp.]MDF1716869.1 hypothetical protein [Antarcticimicrobium sp.]